MAKKTDIRGQAGIEEFRRIFRKWHGVELFLSDSSGNVEMESGALAGQGLLREIREKTLELRKSERDREVGVFDSGRLMGVGLFHKGGFRGMLWGRALTGVVASAEKREYLGELLVSIAGRIARFREEEPRGGNVPEGGMGEKCRPMVGESRKMREVYGLLEKIAAFETSVFIQGANGTGKELVARAIHRDSPRKDRIFLAVNCSAFNDNLLDSELFGHVRGAFTGAIKSKKGLFALADGGTLFLDEIGDTSPAMQVKLLRALQEGAYLPVGSDSSKKCDVRIITSTNKPIEEMIEQGKFREDLYYRLNVINIGLPPLKDRMEDIPLLIDHFMEKKCGELGVPLKKLSDEAIEQMFEYHWPGNVRELENELERLIVLSGDERLIRTNFLAPRISRIPRLTLSKGEGGIKIAGKLKDAIEEVERKMIREGLRRCSFNKSRLARELGISRASLISKVYKYALEDGRRREAA